MEALTEVYFLMEELLQIINGWQAFPDSNRLQYWDYKEALIHLQVIYGIFPYYKVTVENRYTAPYDYIITIGEGDVGLPNKYFYNIDLNSEIIKSYKLLLRDFAINMGIVSRQAELFADEIFHYEQRIANHIDNVQSTSMESDLNTIHPLSELKNLAPLLPISQTLRALFPHTKIKDDTEIMVHDVKVLRELSTVISTSDKKSINNFLIWSLARNLLPHLHNQEYRNLTERFDQVLYGHTHGYPRWLLCTKLVRDWLPFAVDALKQSQEVDKVSQVNNLQQHFINNDKFLKLMYYSLRNQLQQSIKHTHLLTEQVKRFINDKLTSMRLQIGIPEEELKNKSYVEMYYNDLLLDNLYFVEHLESIWSFRKARMEQKLKSLNLIDTIISEMYSAPSRYLGSVAYSKILNMLIISRNVLFSQYYEYRYPVAVNFARLGTDILQVLIDTIPIFMEQYAANNIEIDNEDESGIRLPKFDMNCLRSDHNTFEKNYMEGNEGPAKALQTILSAAKVSGRALSAFVTAIDGGEQITGAAFDSDRTYETLGLTRRLRLPGLRSYNDNELFTLAYMQRHCSIPLGGNDYAQIKPYLEQKFSENYLFNATWGQVHLLQLANSCPVLPVLCPHLL